MTVIYLMTKVDPVCWCNPNHFHIWVMPGMWCNSLCENRSHSTAQKSVELLGKEHSSDQRHMRQEVCQHFSSSSIAIGRGLSALPASKEQHIDAWKSLTLCFFSASDIELFRPFNHIEPECAHWVYIDILEYN